MVKGGGRKDDIWVAGVGERQQSIWESKDINHFREICLMCQWDGSSS
jgi:hypothetical protein